MDYLSFEVIKKLYFVRTSGSEEELKAANILAEEAKKIGVNDVVIEECDVDGYEVKKASCKFLNPDIDVECVGVGMSSSTPVEGIRAPFIYISSIQDAKVKEVKGKICMIHSKLVNYKLYKYLVENGALGLILCTGSVYKNDDEVDLDPYMYRERHYVNGKIPAVCIRMKDAESILIKNPLEVHLVMVEEEKVNKSHNVIATIEGTSKKDEIICFSAHYDSVSFSKGAYDNATGSACLMQLLSNFVKDRPSRTLKFIWCGSEECGLLGSKAYVKAHEEELARYLLNINVDMIGVTIGGDIAVATSEMGLVNYIKYKGMIDGFAISSKQGVYSSDSTPFADKGIPSVSFARISPQGGATIHSHDDIIDFLSEDNYYRTCDFIYDFSKVMANSICFPIDRNIPDNMKLELDYYLGRKDRPE